MGSQLRLTVQDLDRARILAAQGWATREVLDQRQSEFNVAVATYQATEATIGSATAGVEAATHNADLIEVNIADNTLTAPKHGPINGSAYVQQVILAEVQRSLSRSGIAPPDAVTTTVHLAFNPNATPGWFMSVTGIINNIAMLAILLCGAAVIREREHGTMNHLLTLPLSPVEIASAKVLANGFVILVATALSLYGVVQGLLGMPIAGSIPLFLFGVAL